MPTAAGSLSSRTLLLLSFGSELPRQIYYCILGRSLQNGINKLDRVRVDELVVNAPRRIYHSPTKEFQKET
jgi:hypothetical protein